MSILKEKPNFDRLPRGPLPSLSPTFKLVQTQFHPPTLISNIHTHLKLKFLELTNIMFMICAYLKNLTMDIQKLIVAQRIILQLRVPRIVFSSELSLHGSLSGAIWGRWIMNMSVSYAPFLCSMTNNMSWIQSEFWWFVVLQVEKKGRLSCNYNFPVSSITVRHNNFHLSLDTHITSFIYI